MKVAIIDYQLSNLFSVLNACKFVEIDAGITSDRKEIEKANAAILPGVGAFGDAMSNLKRLGLVEVIKDFIASGKPFLGVCLGMQLLFSKSEEFGLHNGLDIIRGSVKKFHATGEKGKKTLVPQIGWNRIFRQKGKNNWLDSPLRDIRDGEFMYFVHSYYTNPVDKALVLTKTEYAGIKYCSGILHNNVFAVQFHPEKSGREGIKIYRDWFFR